MNQVIMIGCDLHDRTMVLQYAVGMEQPQQASYQNNNADRARMMAFFKSLARKCRADRIVFAYEASGLGFGLCDQLHEAGIECHVLSPSHLAKTAKSAKQKTDVRDAFQILEAVRGHVLAGNRLPIVWTPPQRLRDDRELVRARVDVADEITRVKLKLKSIFKRYELLLKNPTKTQWTKAFIRHLKEDILPHLDFTLATKLGLLVKRLEMYQAELVELDKQVKRLSQMPRYQKACRELQKLPGVGLLVAMTFLTEMGDLTRFHNRREVAAYLGLIPSTYESGNNDNRKGPITRQGPTRLRKLLCQAAWVAVIHCEETAASYRRIRQNQKHRTKKALVAIMRQLGIKMWHVALAMGVSTELMGRGGPHGEEQLQEQLSTAAKKPPKTSKKELVEMRT